jgi:hypothetical protein
MYLYNANYSFIRDMNMRFDLTAVQEAFRDQINIDVLFILSCCYASHEGWSKAADDHALEHKVEVLSSGPEAIYDDRSDADFFMRVAHNFYGNNNPKTVRVRSQEIDHEIEKWDTRDQASVKWTSMYDDGRADIVLGAVDGWETAEESEGEGEEEDEDDDDDDDDDDEDEDEDEERK